MQQLLEKVIEKQNEKHLNNSQFSRLIGISESMWRSIRNGDRLIGDKTLNGIIVAFPELDREILAYIRRKNGHQPKTVA